MKTKDIAQTLLRHAHMRHLHVLETGEGGGEERPGAIERRSTTELRFRFKFRLGLERRSTTELGFRF